MLILISLFGAIGWYVAMSPQRLAFSQSSFPPVIRAIDGLFGCFWKSSLQDKRFLGPLSVITLIAMPMRRRASDSASDLPLTKQVKINKDQPVDHR